MSIRYSNLFVSVATFILTLLVVMPLFLQETLQQKVKPEERLQQIILSQSIPRLGFWQRVRMLFGQQEQVKNV